MTPPEDTTCLDTIEGLMENYIFKSRNRLFINTEIGCNAKCSYCYLEQLGFSSEEIIKEITSKKIVDEIKDRIENQLYSRDINISFGCYSDPWSNTSKIETINIIKEIEPLDLKISLATKQHITKKDLALLSTIKNKKKIFFLISMPIAVDNYKYELGTSSIQDRIDSIKNVLSSGFYAALYIKPFLPNITRNGLSIYQYIIKKFNIPIILGRKFSPIGTGKEVMISKFKKFYEEERLDYLTLKRNLELLTTVYENSTDLFEIGKKQ